MKNENQFFKIITKGIISDKISMLLTKGYKQKKTRQIRPKCLQQAGIYQILAICKVVTKAHVLENVSLRILFSHLCGLNY